MKQSPARLVTMWACAAVIFTSGAALAASHEQHSAHGSHGAAVEQQMKQAEVEAKVVSIATDGSSVEIDHAPIPAFSWPAMQMSIDLEQPDLATGIKPGDQVMVIITQRSATDYVITGIIKH